MGLINSNKKTDGKKNKYIYIYGISLNVIKYNWMIFLKFKLIIVDIDHAFIITIIKCKIITNLGHMP